MELWQVQKREQITIILHGSSRNILPSLQSTLNEAPSPPVQVLRCEDPAPHLPVAATMLKHGGHEKSPSDSRVGDKLISPVRI